MLLHHHAPGPAAASSPLDHAQRAAAPLKRNFAAAFADRDAGVWRPPPLAARPRQGSPSGGGTTAAQSRALPLVRAGRLGAAARALTATPFAPRTPAVWENALALFPPARPGLATAPTLAAAFPAALTAAAEFGRAAGVPTALPRGAVDAAIRRAPRGSAPGPSGLRKEPLRALGEEEQASLGFVVRLRAGGVPVRRVPPLAAQTLAGAELLLLCKPGAADGDGLPRLRPIGRPEILRKLAAASLAGAVRTAASRLLSPLQMGVGVPNPCERVVHEDSATHAHDPSAALVQLDFRNAFNLVSLPAAAASVSRAFPVFCPYLESVYRGGAPPRVYGWVSDATPAGGAVGPLKRLWLGVERGVQQGDPLGPLLHAAATHLSVQRISEAHPAGVGRDVHDDEVVVTPHTDLLAVLQSAAAAGAAVDAELAPAKCAGWSPTGAAALAHWPARWHSDGVMQFSLPLGSDAFVAAAVDRLAATHGALTDAIAALPPSEVQSQLLLFRLYAGPQPNYWLRALSLVWGGRLAGYVDRAAQSSFRRLLTDARDPSPDVVALIARAAAPLTNGGLGIGGRSTLARAAAMASRVDCLRARPLYSPTLKAVAEFLFGADAVPTRTAPPPSHPSFSADMLAAFPGRYVARRPPHSASHPADLAAGPPALAASPSPVVAVAACLSVAGARSGAPHRPPPGPLAASNSPISCFPTRQSRPPGAAARF